MSRQKSNNDIFLRSGLFLIGNNNLVIGDNNKITGSFNRVCGKFCTVIGNNVTVMGTNCDVTGHNVNVIGDGCIVSGNNCVVVGEGNVVTGNNCTLNGEPVAARTIVDNVQASGGGTVTIGGVRFSDSDIVSNASADASRAYERVPHRGIVIGDDGPVFWGGYNGYYKSAPSVAEARPMSCDFDDPHDGCAFTLCPISLSKTNNVSRTTNLIMVDQYHGAKIPTRLSPVKIGVWLANNPP